MKSGLIIRKYNGQYLQDLREIFFLNIPHYFYAEEWCGFYGFLHSDLNDNSVYDVCVFNNQVVGSGGIVLQNEKTVVFTRGMIHASHHKTGFCKHVLDHRLALACEMFPTKQIELSTTQHSFGFFEKYKFVTIERQNDFWSKGLDLCKMILPKKLILHRRDR